MSTSDLVMLSGWVSLKTLPDEGVRPKGCEAFLEVASNISSLVLKLWCNANRGNSLQIHNENVCLHVSGFGFLCLYLFEI